MSGPAATPAGLDPTDWEAFRREAHAALDGMIDGLRDVRERPVWREAPAAVRERFAQSLPREGRPMAEVVDDVQRLIAPYATGNTHPAFMGWVHGAGTPAGMVAEMLAAGINANCGGRNHIGLVVEAQIVRWMREAFAFPDAASGLFVTGTSMANFVGLLVARTRALGPGARRAGLGDGPPLIAYASVAAHGCIADAMDMAGLGSDRLRRIPCDATGAMDVAALRTRIDADRAAGLRPFLVVGTAGTVDIGAIDPLAAIADLAEAEDLTFHVDGAFGALAALAPSLKSLLAGIDRADSIAFDFHKWGQVPYDAGFLLVRDGALHRRTFASANGYLTRAATGLAAGETWPCDLGPDLSRGFRALKTWFTFETFGTAGLGAAIERLCALARRLEGLIGAEPGFVLAAPVALNIVCFRVTGEGADAANRRIVEHLHVSGAAAPSITLLDGRATIRCAINNHRTDESDLDRLILALRDARARCAEA